MLLVRLQSSSSFTEPAAQVVNGAPIARSQLSEIIAIGSIQLAEALSSHAMKFADRQAAKCSKDQEISVSFCQVETGGRAGSQFNATI